MQSLVRPNAAGRQVFLEDISVSHSVLLSKHTGCFFAAALALQLSTDALGTERCSSRDRGVLKYVGKTSDTLGVLIKLLIP